MEALRTTRIDDRCFPIKLIDARKNYIVRHRTWLEVYLFFSYSVVILLITMQKQWKHIFPSVGQIILFPPALWFAPEVFVPCFSALLWKCYRNPSISDFKPIFSAHSSISISWWVLAGFPFVFSLHHIPILCQVPLDWRRLTGQIGRLLTSSVSWPRKHLGTKVCEE